jgi:RsiW-degrading membrane proteinase PrsW (M82 family)
VINVAVAVLPVLAFLGALLLMDSFKLVRFRVVLSTILVGCGAALLAFYANGWLTMAAGVSAYASSHYLAPLVEECLKAVYVVVLIRRRRIGFLVDSAIQGFAVGAGFAVVENIDYLRQVADARVFLWIVRGFGTALLHGGTTAIVAIAGKSLADRHPGRGPLVFLPGLLVASAIHSLFNHFILPPVLATAVLLVVLPGLFIAVFERSEKTTRDWLALGLDDELELLESILSGRMLETRVGLYLRSLKDHFPGTALADMLCLLRIHLELSIRAKGLLLAREAGFAVPIGKDVQANLQELRYLEHAIGRTGLLAINPILRRTSRDLWQIYKLEEAGRGPDAR